MKTYKSYVFRMYPNKAQIELICKTFGCTRLVYNHYLDKRKKLYEVDKKCMTCFETIRDLNNLYIEYPFLKEVDSMSLRCALFDLDDAYKNFFKKISAYPKFKSKFDRNSYRTNYISSEYKGRKYSNIKVDLINKTITLPKLKDVSIRGYRNINNIDGRIINATVIREKDNKYYVAVLYEENIEVPNIKPSSIVGIDLGIKNAVTMSDGEIIENNHTLKKYEKRIIKAQRRLSKKIKGSNNYYKTKTKLAILYRKVRNTRKHYINNIANNIVSKYDIIVSETLKVKEMVKDSKLAKSINDISLYEIIRTIENKTKLLGKKLMKINTYYPSSQECSVCGYKNIEIRNISIREYECPKCNNYHDRDINASINIMFEGLKEYIKSVA